MNTAIRKITLTALFAALTAVFSQIQISIQPVPINFATLSVFLAGAILGWKYGALSQIVYVLLGLSGVPVFAGFSSGTAILFGKTGGYIFGYILAAFLTGLISQIKTKRVKLLLSIAMAVAMLSCYTLGTAWFMLITGTELLKSLIWCVFPFLIGDALKISAAVMLTQRLRKAVRTV
ncbi:MAG: biotin transporter BioY [Oscillospiraceae bacterium]|jgi:biotin transport system substrate-specific component